MCDLDGGINDRGEDLYLLEVVVDRVDINHDEFRTTLRAKVFFLDFPALEIEQNEFSGHESGAFPENVGSDRRPDASSATRPDRDRASQSGKKWASGKTNLFQMAAPELARALKSRPLTVQIFYDTTPKRLLGQAKIRLGEKFSETVCLAETPAVLPASAHLEDSVPLLDLFGDTRATLHFLARLTCFGTAELARHKTGAAEERDPGYGALRERRGVKMCPLLSAQVHESAGSSKRNRSQEKTRVPVNWRRTGDPAPPDPPLTTAKAPRPWEEEEMEERDEGRRRILPPPTGGTGAEVGVARTVGSGTVGSGKAAGTGAVCTCPRIPEILLPGPEPAVPACVCQCADILSALRNPAVASRQASARPVPTGPPGTGGGDGDSSRVDEGAARSRRGAPGAGAGGDRESPESLVPAESVRGPEPARKGAAQRRDPDGRKKGGDADGEETGEEKAAKRKRKRETAYEYMAGMYPGVHIGHKYCLPPVRLVPKTMGWLWNLRDVDGVYKPRRGWRPGAVSGQVAKMFRGWKRAVGLPFQPAPVKATGKRGAGRPGTAKSGPPDSAASSSEAADGGERWRPTLHIHRKNGFYNVSMYPVPGEGGEATEPLKLRIDAKGRSEEDFDVSRAPSSSSSSSSSDEESLEIEFTAPAAAGVWGRKPKAQKTDADTQCYTTDFQRHKSPTSASASGLGATTAEPKKGKGKRGGGKKGKGKKGKKK